ncbi:MAG: hypothetical protein J5732_06130 [Bacteroidaceae bacterium]|nr:hypothetical protein [Bacteroidaceae bacterium]
MKKRTTLLFLVTIILSAPFVFAQDDDEPQVKMNKKNLVIKEWNSLAGSTQKILDHVTIYNSEGKKIEEKEYGSDGLKWTKRYEYGNNGKISRELVYNEKNKLINIKIMEYNEFDRKKVQYTYDSKGKLLTTKNYEYIAEDPE